MPDEVTINHLYQPQERFVKIKVIKGQKDSYAWEITTEGETVDDAVTLSQEADVKLKQVYSTASEEKKEVK